jgi:hypothetical protein
VATGTNCGACGEIFICTALGVIGWVVFRRFSGNESVCWSEVQGESNDGIVYISVDFLLLYSTCNETPEHRL